MPAEQPTRRAFTATGSRRSRLSRVERAEPSSRPAGRLASTRRERRLVSRVKIRVAVAEDAPAMGRVMVDSFLSAHRGQMPDAVWQQRVDEWTPDVSARAWARTLADR